MMISGDGFEISSQPNSIPQVMLNYAEIDKRQRYSSSGGGSGGGSGSPLSTAIRNSSCISRKEESRFEGKFQNRFHKSINLRNVSNPKRDGPTRPQAPVAQVNRLIEPSIVIRFLCYFSYLVLILFGYLNMFLEWSGWRENISFREHNRKGYPPLYKNWAAFFTRYIYRRVSDIFNQPITGNPGGFVRVLHRKSSDGNLTFKLTGGSHECINLASYDYLGFSRSICGENARVIEDTIHQYGVGISPLHELGKLNKHIELEKLFAKFLGVEECMVFGMGFATNSTNIPSLCGEGCLIIADQYSHASAKSGMYLSGSTYRYFKHNDCDDLERIIRNAIITGNKGHRWKKIIIIVEGVYSMEGTIVNLPRLIEVKKRYKCYLYIDEAHSIGAIGQHGRGIVDYFHCDPNDVDLLMGTMTKSFAAAGGYIAGRKELIDYIRVHSNSNYAGAMSAPIAQQIINSLHVLMKETDDNSEGHKRIETLLWNTRYMRRKLRDLGFIVFGNDDSPVIPIMIYLPAKVGSIVRMAVKNGLGLICAGYPATTLTTCRIRLCMTAAHSKDTLDKAIRILSMIGDVHQIKYAKYRVMNN